MLLHLHIQMTSTSVVHRPTRYVIQHTCIYLHQTIVHGKNVAELNNLFSYMINACTKKQCVLVSVCCGKEKRNNKLRVEKKSIQICPIHTNALCASISRANTHPHTNQINMVFYFYFYVCTKYKINYGVAQLGRT